MTHASGLQYSYDDLDLVCCHGVDGEGPWMGAGASKQGRRTRCASMPEGCHQLPTEDIAQTVEVTASVVNDNTEAEEVKLMKSNVKVPLDLQEDSAHSPHDLVDIDMPQGASELEHHHTTNTGNHEESLCNNGMSDANISCATDGSSQRKNTNYSEGEVGTERRQSHDISNDENVLKSPHITHEEQQCISISSHNGPPLSESAGELPGKLPNHQETMESHAQGYSRPPEIFDTTLNQSSAAGLEPQADLPEVEGEKFFTVLPVGVRSSTLDVMENCDVMSQASNTVEQVGTSVVEELCDKGGTENWSSDSADELDGLNGTGTLNENPGFKCHLTDIKAEEQDHHERVGVMDPACGTETFYQLSLEQHNETTVIPLGEESAQAEDATFGPIKSPENCEKGQCCSSTVEKRDEGCSEEHPIKTNMTYSADQYLEMATSESPPRENRDESSVSKESTCCETAGQQLESCCSKLDTIPEVSHIEVDDIPALDPQKNSSFTQNPDVQCFHVYDKPPATKQDTAAPPPLSAEVCDELSPEGLHSNQEASGHFSESPGSEVADGQREHHRPAAAVSRMEDEAAHTVLHSDTQLVGPVLERTKETDGQKEDNVVKVRMRKVSLLFNTRHLGGMQ